MKLSKKGEYALRSLINLGIAAEVGRSLVQVAELAESEQLPVKFLEQIMQALKAAGYVESVRGKFGGYRLAKPAGKITIGEIVRIIDGPQTPPRRPAAAVFSRGRRRRDRAGPRARSLRAQTRPSRLRRPPR
jgi:Rrf2 family protein